MGRVILHCDLNNFFASVSLLSNATLVNEPVAVCGDKENRHGIVLAKNEIAKKYGVKTAEAIWQAKRKCKDLICLPPDYKSYLEYSEKAKEIYLKYTDMVEPFGIDECWLDVTGSVFLFGSGEEIAEKIRKEIKSTLGITVSVGVSFNKCFAKLGSDMKKPDAVTVISEENFREKVWCLPIEDLLFAGKSTKTVLNSSGIFTVGDVANCDARMLKRLLGKNGEELKKCAMGLDESPVKHTDEISLPKSIGKSVTLSKDFEGEKEIWEQLIVLSEEVSRKLIKYGLYAKGVQLHIRDTSLKSKEVIRSLEYPTNLATVIAGAGIEIWRENFRTDVPYRSVGIRAVNLSRDVFAVQQNMFDAGADSVREETVERQMYSLREKYGKGIIKRGVALESGKNGND